MRALFKFCFEQLTDPLELSIEWYWEILILIIVGEIAYRIAFSVVREMYNDGFISGGTTGSFFHWLIRLVVYTFMCYVINMIIWLVKFIMTNYDIIIAMFLAILLSLAFSIIIVKIIRYIGQYIYYNVIEKGAYV